MVLISRSVERLYILGLFGALFCAMVAGDVQVPVSREKRLAAEPLPGGDEWGFDAALPLALAASNHFSRVR
jgi:hypothetical protein